MRESPDNKHIAVSIEVCYLERLRRFQIPIRRPCNSLLQWRFDSGRCGLTPTQYSMAFSINAIGFIGAWQFAGFLGGRFGMGRMVTAAVSAYASFAVLLLALTLAGFDSLRVLMPLLFASFAFLGLVIPSTMVLSLENHGRIAGIASALGGTLQMVAGAIITGIAGLFFDGTSLPMVATVAAASMAAFVLSVVTLRKKDLRPVVAALNP